MKFTLGISSFLKEISSISHSIVSLYLFANRNNLQSLSYLSLLFSGNLHSFGCMFPFFGFHFSSFHQSVSSVTKSCPTLWPHESQHIRHPCPSQTPGVYSNSCPLSRWCHPAISSSVIPFSSCPQSLQASGSFPMNQLFAWGGQSIGVSASASVLPMNIQD